MVLRLSKSSAASRLRRLRLPRAEVSDDFGEAEADVGSELKGESLDAKLAKIKGKAASASAKAQLEEMKKQMAARRAAQEAGGVKKTI